MGGEQQMPFDGTYLRRADLRDAIALLDRGLARVTAGYCWGPLYKAPTWYHKAPRFCMLGSLCKTDDGLGEYLDCEHRLAAEYLVKVIGGRSLVEYGTRLFVRRKVIRAYKRAIALAKADAAVGP
jgi:hypothetical protein